jgi:hypothetical protein
MPVQSLLYQAQQAGPVNQSNTESQLSFASSETFRKELIVKNLKPYNMVGFNDPPQPSAQYQQSNPNLSASEVLFSLENFGFPPVIKNTNANSTLIPSTYTAYEILTKSNPNGNNGSLSQDSYLAKIGSQVLKTQLLSTDAFFTNQEILSKSSVNFQITTSDVNDTFLSKLEGSYIGSSPIPGDLFLDGLNKRNTDNLGEIINLAAGRSTILGGLFNGASRRVINFGQILLESTNDGQKDIMFSNISYNIFRPAYGDSLLGGLAGNLITTGVNNLLDNFGLKLPGAYYVGSSISDPSFANSPLNAVPIDVFGNATQSIVYGPDVLGKDYEGNEGKISFGLASKAYINQNNLEGNIIWVSPKYKSGNEQFWSTSIDFRPGSILDETQRLIDSADRLQGEQRLKHVGNAINQSSTIFHDGYKKITKGSQVKSVTYNNGSAVVGEEYCRIFTKSSPYATNNRLQQSDGIVNFGRKFDNSVLNNTYNLNIYPSKITQNEKPSWVGTTTVKKYMFSIENLAWKDSKRPGFNVQDLPLCERGPNGGRIMWFAPYELKFNDNSTANWQDTNFLGRPEPVYTYRNTSRNGTLSWKIVVDHPSVLNLIVDKVLEKEIDSNADEVINSFFAGCQTYDLYELAAKFNTASLNDIQFLQESLQRATPEEQNLISESIPVLSTDSTNATKISENEAKSYNFERFGNLGFYFDNDIPKIGSTQPYSDLYSEYISKKQIYKQKTKQTPNTSVEIFFDNIITNNYNQIISGPQDPGLILTIYEALTTNSVKFIEIQMEGSASASASDDYNQKLSERRVESVKEFFKSFKISSGQTEINISKFIDEGKVKISYDAKGERATKVTPQGGGNDKITVAACTTKPKVGNVTLTDNQAIYVTDSMACRSVRIKSINAPASDPPKPPPNEPTEEITNNLPGPKQSIKPSPAAEFKRIPGLSKKVLRMLLSECNYFQAMEQESPFIYNSLKEKLKYFHPAFHSTTPEGLNSRLTFLNQCLRPGDTIPTIGTDGRPIYNDAINTAFGRPPVLVLRIGDFYNSKIIPRNIQFAYEPLVLDMNREGIGIQPMIANVTLTFDFIGGQGLARPIEELQNALSFNYYANTEIFDERSTPTEDVSELDALIAKSIEERENKTDVRDATTQQQNPGGTTIGTILTTNSDGVDFSGTIDYKGFLESNIDSLQNYFNTLVQTSKSVSETYNFYVWQYVNCERKYTTGTVAGIETHIYGIPKNLDQLFTKLFGTVLSDILSDNNLIVQDFIDRGFTDVVLRQLKQNLVNYIDLELRGDFLLELNQQLQLIYQNQNDIIKNFDKANFIYSEYDGSIKTDGSPIVYNVSGATGVTGWFGVVDDILNFGSDADNFITLLETNGIVDEPSSFESVSIKTTSWIIDPEEEQFFTIMSKTMTDINLLQKLSDYLFPEGNKIAGVEVNSPVPPKDFFNSIVGLSPTTYGELRYQSTYYERYNGLKKELIDFVDKFIKTNKDYKNKYEKYANFRKITTSRTANYSTTPTPPDSAKTELLNLYKSVPTTDNKFNGKIF